MLDGIESEEEEMVWRIWLSEEQAGGLDFSKTFNSNVTIAGRVDIMEGGVYMKDFFFQTLHDEIVETKDVKSSQEFLSF